MDSDSDSDSSTVCGGECTCFGYDDLHLCGTLNCERCSLQHTKPISVQVSGNFIPFRLCQDKVYPSFADEFDTCGVAMLDVQIVFIENCPYVDTGFYYFT